MKKGGNFLYLKSTQSKRIFYGLTVVLGLFLVIFGSAGIFSDRAFSYDTEVAHPNIAELAANLYNEQNFTRKLTAEEIAWIKQGAEDEDKPTRWLNHFYDPIYKVGLTFGRNWFSSKEWAFNSKVQQDFSLGDQSWPRALFDFKKGNNELAFKELGHVLHLLADATVPAHTRNQIHALPPDSYEQFVKYNWTAIVPNLKYGYVGVNDLGQAFDDLANYSNNNFYSDKTIESSKYKIINIISSIKFKDGNNYYFYNIASEGNYSYKLFVSEDNNEWIDIANKNSGKKSVIYSQILSEYSQHLLPKAIGYSAGVIKLFFDQVDNSDNKGLSFLRESLLGYRDELVGSLITGAEDIFNYWQGKSGYTGPVFTAEEPVIKSLENVDNNLVVETNTKLANSAVTKNNNKPIVEEIKQTDTKLPEIISDNSSVVDGHREQAEVLAPPEVNNSLPLLIAPPLQVSSLEGLIIYGSNSGGTTQIVYNNPVNVTINLPISTSTENTTTTITESVVTTTTELTSTSTIAEDISTSNTSTIDVTPTSTTFTPEEAIVPEIVINEIAWPGTYTITRYDQWLELYNNTDRDINLAGWKLDISGTVITLPTSTILAHNYYLLERNRDDVVLEFKADYVFKLYSTLNFNGENLKLFNSQGKMIDQVDADSGWFAGDLEKYCSMERIDSTKDGNNQNNWQTSLGNRALGRSYNSVYLCGSPKQANTGDIVLRGDQQENNLVLSKANNPYILQGFNVPQGKTLTIEPGVLIKARANSILRVYGSLNSIGTLIEPIIFTSANDNPTPANWVGIWFFSGATGEFDQTKIYYGGKPTSPPGAGSWTPDVKRVVDIESAVVNFNNTEFENNDGVLIYLNRATSSIKNVNFKNGLAGVWSESSNLILTDSNLENLTYEKGPVYIRGNWPSIKNLTLINNANNKVYFDTVDISTDQTINKELSQMSNFTVLTVWPSTVLDIDPGSEISFVKGGGINVGGSLKSNGSQSEPVIFHPVDPGSKWGMLKFQNSSSSLQYTNLLDGNYSGSASGDGGIIYAHNSNLSLDHLQVSNPGRPGSSLFFSNSKVTLDNSHIYDTQKYTSLWLPSYGLKAQGGEITLNNNTFTNIQLGISADNSSLLNLYSMATSSFTNVDNLIQWSNWQGFGE